MHQNKHAALPSRPSRMKIWANKQAGIQSERGHGWIPLAPFPISSQGAFRGNPPVFLVPPVSLLVGFPRYAPGGSH